MSFPVRWVSNSSKMVKVSSLLEETEWFSMREMTDISSATLMWKILNNRTPRKFYEELTHNTENMEIDIKEPRLQFTDQDFLLRAGRH